MKKDSSEQQQRVLRKLIRLHGPSLDAMSQQWGPELSLGQNAEGAKSAPISRRQSRARKVTSTSNANLNSFVDTTKKTDNQSESRQYNSTPIVEINTQQSTNQEIVECGDKNKKPRKKRVSRALFRHDKIDYIKPKKQDLLQNSFSFTFKKLVDKSKEIYSKLDEDEELADNNTEDIMKNNTNVMFPIKCPESQTKSKNSNNQLSSIEKPHISTQKIILDMPSLDVSTNETHRDIKSDKDNCNNNEFVQKPSKNIEAKANKNKRTLRTSEENKDERKKTINKKICHSETNSQQTLHCPFYGLVKQNTIAQENAQKQKTVEDQTTVNSAVNTEKDNRNVPPYFPHNFYPVPPPYFFPHVQNITSKYPQIPQFNYNNYSSYPFFPYIGSNYKPNNVFQEKSSNTDQHNNFQSKIAEISSTQNEKMPKTNPDEQIKNLEHQIIKNSFRRNQNLNEEIKQNFRNLQMSVPKTKEQNSKKSEKQNLETKKSDFKSQICVVQNISHRKQNISLENEEKDFRLERKRPGTLVSSEINIKNPRLTANTTVNENNSSNNELRSSNLTTTQSNQISNCVSPTVEPQKSVIISPNVSKNLQENQSIVSSTCCSVITKVPRQNINKHSIDNILSLKCSTKKGSKSEKIKILNVQNIPACDHRYLNVNQNKFFTKQNEKTSLKKDNMEHKKIDSADESRPMPKLMKAEQYFLNLNKHINNQASIVPKETSDKQNPTDEQSNSITPLNLSLKKDDQTNDNQNRQTIIVENAFKNEPQQLIKSLIENEKYDMELSFVKTDEEYEEYLKLLKERNALRPYLFYKFVTQIQKQNKKPMFDLITFFCLLKKGKLINYKNLYNKFNEKQ